MKPVILIMTVAIAVSCNGWTNREKQIINNGPEVLRVLSIDDANDREVLRDISRDIPTKIIGTATYENLCRKMLTTVTDSTQNGVGIAGPQIGISRRIVAVQRFDKPGNPFEVYPNIRITELRGPKTPGSEGCLSIPERYASVLRSRDISISYTSPATLTDTSETVSGFTAVIFQHECDHLDGIVFTDRIWEERDSWYRAASSPDSAATSSPDSTVANSSRHPELVSGSQIPGQARDDDAVTSAGTLAAGSTVFPCGAAPADVFYLVSTGIYASYDAQGNEVFNARLTPGELEILDRELAFVQNRLFGDSLNFYSPRYHLVTMRGFEQDSDKYYIHARNEVLDAFDYYIQHENNGRPFVLAGFSQGAMMVLEVLRHIRPQDYSRMLAAYVIGFGIDADDAACEFIRPATGPDDIGACYSHNTVTDTTYIWAKVLNNAVCCINPANWSTDCTPASFEHDGQILTVHQDTLKHVLIARGFKDPATGVEIQGCLHVGDLVFYAPFIRRNALGRIY